MVWALFQNQGARPYLGRSRRLTAAAEYITGRKGRRLTPKEGNQTRIHGQRGRVGADLRYIQSMDSR